AMYADSAVEQHEARGGRQAGWIRARCARPPVPVTSPPAPHGSPRLPTAPQGSPGLPTAAEEVRRVLFLFQSFIPASGCRVAPARQPAPCSGGLRQRWGGCRRSRCRWCRDLLWRWRWRWFGVEVVLLAVYIYPVLGLWAFGLFGPTTPA